MRKSIIHCLFFVFLFLGVVLGKPLAVSAETCQCAPVTSPPTCSDNSVAQVNSDQTAVSACITGQTSYCCPTDFAPKSDEASIALKALNLCEQIEGDASSKCASCLSGGGYWSALGCIPTNPLGLTTTVVQIGMGIAGLLLFAQIIIGAGEIIFGSGDPGKVQNARKRIVSSIMALLFIVFGVAILQIIGVNILKLPGFFGA